MNFTVQQREYTGKRYNRKLRGKGLAPGVVYGGEQPLLVSMREDYAMRFIRNLKGTKSVFELTIESQTETLNKSVILQDYQYHSWGKKLVHVDFLEVTEQTQLSIEVPIQIINEESCPAIETGGVIQVIRRSVPVKCMVKDVPEYVVVDVQNLEFGESIHVLDIEYPPGVKPVVLGRNFTLLTVAGRIADEETGTDEIEAADEVGKPAEVAD
jgi:large subunit ribosomal protein L25